MTTALEAKIGVLTKDNIKAIRKANRVSLRQTRDGAFIHLLGGSYIGCASLNEKIPVESSVRDYVPSTYGQKYVCSTTSQQLDAFTVAKSIFSILKAGDEIQLKWTANNTNTYMENANITMHSVEIYVTRRTTKKTNRLRFTFDTEATSAASSVQMIRRV